MRDNGEHLCTTLLEHVEDALHGEESVRVLFLADALEEDWQVVVVVQGHDVDLPLDPVLRTVLDADRQVSSVVETAEFRWGHLSSFNGTSHRLGWSSLLWSLCSREGLAADSLTLLESCKHRHKVTSSHSEKERVFKINCETYFISQEPAQLQLPQRQSGRPSSLACESWGNYQRQSAGTLGGACFASTSIACLCHAYR